jgi:hypothetical protein
MRWTRWALAGVLLAISLATSGGAFAKSIIINPPGSAGANEYSEVIPSSAGNIAPPSVGGGSGRVSPGALASLGRGRAGIARLEDLGNQGRSAAALAAATAPPRAPSGSGTTRSSGATPIAGSGGSATSGVLHVATGSDAGGLGLLMPLLLGTPLVVAIGVALARMRARIRSLQPGG